MYLIRQGVWKWIDPERKDLETLKPGEISQEEKDKAMATLWMMVTEDQHRHLGNDLNEPRKAWSLFCNYHDKRALIFQMNHERKLEEIQFTDHRKMDEFLLSLYDQYEKLTASGGEMKESQYLTKLISKLPSEYRPLIYDVNSRLIKKDEIKISEIEEKLKIDAMSIVQAKENDRRMNHFKTKDETKKELGLAAQESTNGNRNIKKCFYCDKPGHIKSVRNSLEV